MENFEDRSDLEVVRHSLIHDGLIKTLIEGSARGRESRGRHL